MLEKEYAHTVPVVHPKDVANGLFQGKTVFFLDTREEVEYEVSTINGAYKVGYSDFNKEAVKELKKDDIIVVYCTIGVRSEKAGEILINNGYSNVYNLYGGIINWVNQGYPLYNSTGKETRKVHVYSEPWSKWLTSGKAVY